MEKIEWKQGLNDEELSKHSMRSILLVERNKSPYMREVSKRKRTEKFRQDVRKSRLGKTHSKETKKKISDAKKGMTRSEESRKKQSNTLIDELAFDKGISQLIAYKKKFNTVLVPSKYVTKCGYKLGVWVSSQRKLYDKNELLYTRIKKLNSVKFIWDVYEYEWNISYNHLLLYKKSYGNCNVPQRYVTDCNFALGMWVCNQRKIKSVYQKNKKYFHRITMLKDVGFVWKVE